MIRKRSGFFHRVRRLLKRVQIKAHRLGTLLLLLPLFFGAAVLPPSVAYMAAENSIIQTLPHAQTLEQQGRELYEAEQFSEAAQLWQQAVAAFKTTGDNLRQAMTLSNLSLAYQQLGQWSEAEQAIQEAIALLNSQNPNTSPEQAQILAQALDVQGRLQLARGQAEPALNTWKQAADIYAQIGDEAALSHNHINQAQAMQDLGLYPRACKTLLTALELDNTNCQEFQEQDKFKAAVQTFTNQPASPLKVLGLRSLGNVLRLIGSSEQSQKVLEVSLQFAQQLREPQTIASVYLSLGDTARVQQDTQAALEYYRQADATATSPTIQIQAQLNQLNLLLEDQQLIVAPALWTKIPSQISNLPLSRTAVYARIHFAESLIRLKQKITKNTPSWQEIAQLLTTAVQQAKSLEDQRATSYALGNLGEVYERTQEWTEAKDLTQQALFIAQAIDASDIAYQWQWQLGRLFKEQGDIKGAIAAYTEAYNTLQSLRYDLVTLNPDVQFSFRDEVEPVYRQLVDLLLQPQGTSEPSKENLDQARKVIESLQLAELDNFLREACLVATPDIDQVIDQSDRTAVAIYPIILADRIEIILKLPQQPLRHYTTHAAHNQVENTLEELRKNLTQPDTLKEAQSLSQQVYSWLIQPAVTDLTQSHVQTLVFVLDGSLRNIPMAALYDGQQYLVEKYGIALAPGLQLVDPKPLEQQQLKALAAGISQANKGFPPLNYVEKELEQIQSEVPAQVLLDQQFTKEAFQNQINSQSFPVVHLATHGQFSSNAEETFILAWDEFIKVNELNSLLRTRDQSRPDAIELLVLSACETAFGDKRAALGLAGMAIRAGARSTLASLWSVDDESTAILMSQFYQELANNALTKAEALRRAQLALLKNPQYQRPLFWAPYVLLGNWL